MVGSVNTNGWVAGCCFNVGRKLRPSWQIEILYQNVFADVKNFKIKFHLSYFSHTSAMLSKVAACLFITCSTQERMSIFMHILHELYFQHKFINSFEILHEIPRLEFYLYSEIQLCWCLINSNKSFTAVRANMESCIHAEVLGLTMRK